MKQAQPLLKEFGGRRIQGVELLKQFMGQSSLAEAISYKNGIGGKEKNDQKAIDIVKDKLENNGFKN